MRAHELFRIAQSYQIQIGDTEKAIAFYKEIVQLYPNTFEAEQSKVCIAKLRGYWMEHGYIVVPISLRPEIQKFGGIQLIRIGDKHYNVRIPANTRIGQKIRLKGIAHHLDQQLLGGDVHLLITTVAVDIYKEKRDVYMELPIDFKNLKANTIKRINLDERKVDVKIPEGIAPGKKIRLKNYAQYCNDGYYGDVYLKIVEMNRLKWNLRGFFRKFGQLDGYKISLKFGIPFLFEIGGEFQYRVSKVEVAFAA